MELLISLYAIAGVLLFEASRGYRALMTGLAFIPDGRVGAYFLVIGTFVFIAVIISNLFAGTSGTAAVLFGYGIPNGLHWVAPSNTGRSPPNRLDNPSNEQTADTMDDAADDTFEDDVSEDDYVQNKNWLDKFFFR